MYFKFSETWLVEISVIAITEFTEANGTDAYVYETQLMDEHFAGVSSNLFVFL